MKLLIICTTLILLASNVELQYKGRRRKIDVAAIYKEAGIPAAINFPTPTVTFQVTLNGNTRVNLGNNIFVGYTTELTSIGGIYVSPDCYYTLMVFDIDLRINNTNLSPLLQGMIMNIKNLDLQSGNWVSEYIPAGPIPNNGVIRVLFYLFSQQQKIDVSCESIANYRTDRIAFPLEDFVKENCLCLTAGNWFYTSYPDNLQEVCQDTCVKYCESCVT